MPVTHAGEQGAPPGERGAVSRTPTRGRQASTESNAGRSAGRWCSPRGRREGFWRPQSRECRAGSDVSSISGSRARYGVCKGMDGAGVALLLVLFKPSTSAAFWMHDPGRVTSLWGAYVTASVKQW